MLLPLKANQYSYLGVIEVLASLASRPSSRDVTSGLIAKVLGQKLSAFQSTCSLLAYLYLKICLLSWSKLLLSWSSQVSVNSYIVGGGLGCLLVNFSLGERVGMGSLLIEVGRGFFFASPRRKKTASTTVKKCLVVARCHSCHKEYFFV